MKVIIDQSGCIGCGLCAETCPEVFRLADDSLAEVYSPPSEDIRDKVKEAAECCPVSVIKIEN